MKTKKLGFLGAGNMAGALIKGLCHGNVLPPQSIVASDVKPERLEQLRSHHGIRTTTDNHSLVRESDVIVLSVKPQVIDKVLSEVAGVFGIARTTCDPGGRRISMASMGTPAATEMTSWSPRTSPPTSLSTLSMT